MKKARFEELLSSVKQATEIARGARAPSRTFEVNADDDQGAAQPDKAQSTRIRLFARCGA